jgi:hypothetical protein
VSLEVAVGGCNILSMARVGRDKMNRKLHLAGTRESREGGSKLVQLVTWRTCSEHNGDVLVIWIGLAG